MLPWLPFVGYKRYGLATMYEIVAESVYNRDATEPIYWEDK
jgi:hypothetical protein